MVSSYFSSLELLPSDPIFEVAEAFAKDERVSKVNLGVGSYRDAEGAPYVFPSVRRAEEKLVAAALNKEYLPLGGHPDYLREIARIVLGDSLVAELGARMFSLQTVGATGALRLGGELFRHSGGKEIYLSSPTWANHRSIFTQAQLQLCEYPYYDRDNKDLAFSSLCQAVTEMPPHSLVLLHACCHNPTGVDPSKEQWQEIASLCRKYSLIPFFDLAYQGWGEDLEKDAASIRLCIEGGCECLVAVSGAKNFGLYGERTGALLGICQDEKGAAKALNRLKATMRAFHSSASLHGARIVAEVLKADRTRWEQDLACARRRVEKMRVALAAELGEEFSFIRGHKGFFSLLGLTHEQVERLRAESALFLPASGRVNFAGLTEANVEYVADAIRKV